MSRACCSLRGPTIFVSHINRTRRASYTAINLQRQQPSTEQTIETHREQPAEVQLPQCTTGHARHAESNVTRMLQSPWPDDLATVFASVRRMRQVFTGPHCQGQDRTENVLREL